jgi:hypothetical protein
VIDNGNKNFLQTANILVAASLFLSHNSKTLSKGGGVYLLKHKVQVEDLSVLTSPFIFVF